MKQILAVASFILLAGVHAQAANLLTISDARIFAPIKGTNATAGYGVFTNNGPRAVSLVIGTVDGFKATELHETKEVDGKMKMSKVSIVTINSKQSFEMKPGGHHIMLFDATREIKEGDKLAVQFLVDGRKESYDFKVVPRVQKDEGHHHH